MANTYNTGVYPEEWAVKLQERLDKPTNWKEACDVIYSDSKIFNLPYMSTEFSVQAGTRGTAYSFSDYTLTNDTLDIATKYLAPVFVDRADLAQCQLANQMELAERQGALIDEQIESAWLANHAAWTDFDNASIGGSAGQITVSISNIDDIIRGIKREIIEANGRDMMNQYGACIVWRPADFEKLEAYLQANGFNLSDETLRRGIMTEQGYYAFGMYHYVSNSHTANHLFAGVRKVETIGILRTTYGQIIISQDPSNGDGPLSGVGMTARVDYGINTKAGHASLVFDVSVS